MTRLNVDHPAIRDALNTSKDTQTSPVPRYATKHTPRDSRDGKKLKTAPVKSGSEYTEQCAPFLPPLTIIIPALPPTVNHMYAANKHGGKRLTDEAKAFREAVAEELADVCRLTRWRYVAGVPLSLTLFLTFGTHARQDGDNRLKAAADALALALGFDDRCIAAYHVYTLGVDPRRPLCEMRLTDARHDAAYQRAAAAALGVE